MRIQIPLFAAGFVLIILLGVVFVTQHIDASPVVTMAADRSVVYGIVEAVPEPPEMMPGELEVRALAASYPTRITNIEIRNDQWALKMDGRWYYWAHGRLLPEELLEDWELYTGIRFYRYSLGPFELTELPPETIARLQNQDPAQTVDTRIRFNDFLDTLYEINSQRTAVNKMVRTRIFGLPVQVHPFLVEPIARVNRRVGQLAKADPAIHEFLLSLTQAHGYNWRNIANTLRRSYHSYGAAIDLLPRTYQRRQVYWLWAAQSGIEEWWNLPIEARWVVPDPIIEAFEAEGFIWGGKWLSFDNIHFEYRPEVIYISRANQ